MPTLAQRESSVSPEAAGASKPPLASRSASVVRSNVCGNKPRASRITSPRARLAPTEGV